MKQFSAPRTHADDLEFVEMVASFYRTELARTMLPGKAAKAAERYRSAMIVARAEAAAKRKEQET